jgi:drug/metabolite transporter (DMT)-like permease
MKYPLTTMAPFTLLTPIFGLIGSIIFYNEGVTLMKLLAYALILSGLAISQWQPRKEKAVEI